VQSEFSSVYFVCSVRGFRQGNVVVVNWRQGLMIALYSDRHQTPLHKAAMHGHMEVTRILAEAGTSLDITDMEVTLLSSCRL